MPLLQDTHDTHKAFVSLKGNRGFLYITFANVRKLVKFAKYLSNKISYTHGAALQEVVNTSPRGDSGRGKNVKV